MIIRDAEKFGRTIFRSAPLILHFTAAVRHTYFFKKKILKHLVLRHFHTFVTSQRASRFLNMRAVKKMRKMDCASDVKGSDGFSSFQGCSLTAQRHTYF